MAVRSTPRVLTECDVCRLFGWSIADFRQARRLLNFPACNYDFGTRGLRPVWDQPTVLAWHHTVSALVGRRGAPLPPATLAPRRT